MYYFQIFGTITLIIAFVVSLVYLFSLSIKVATDRISQKDALRKSFISSFCTWMSIFLLVIVWEDKTNWNIQTGVMVFILFTFVSIALATLSALGLVRRRR